MNTKGKKIILASGSPRRKELLEGLGIRFETDVRNNFEEKYSPETRHEDIPSLMSEGKSFGFHRELAENEILVTSDTMVLCGDRVMGKPHTREDAVGMLKALSGRGHKVITAVTIRDKWGHETQSDTATVHFRQLTDAEIEYYVDTFKPYDKAGAYGIQEWIGYIGITRIEGSFFTIMGLPVHLVYSLLLKFIN